jgi:predicted phosphate transport protein (TIGR00153 family)
MLLFSNRAKTLKGLLSRYIADLRDSIRSFEAFFFAYSTGVCGDELEEFASQVRAAESRCDTRRRAIQNHLAAGTLLPDFRSDIFDLVDRVDRVPNQMEDIVIYVSTAYTSFPKSLSGLFDEIVQRNISCARNLADALDLLLIDLKASMERAKTVEVDETEIDTLERDIYRGIFREEGDTITPGRKLLLKEFVCGVCAVSNRAEDAADRIELLAIKNRA